MPLILRAQLNEEIEIVGVAHIRVADLTNGTARIEILGWRTKGLLESCVYENGDKIAVSVAQSVYVRVYDPIRARVRLVIEAPKHIKINRNESRKVIT